MIKFEISKPCTMVFDCVESMPLEIYFLSGKCYHERIETGQIFVNFPIVGTYLSNYEPIKEMKIQGDYKKSFSSPKVNIVQGNFNTPVAYINLDSETIFLSNEFSKIPYQQQAAIIEHEKAHLTYTDEQQADNLARANYLKLGFNESQYLFALLNYAPNCKDRISNFSSNLKRVK